MQDECKVKCYLFEINCGIFSKKFAELAKDGADAIRIPTYVFHFPISTMSADNEAETISTYIYGTFFNVTNLERCNFYSGWAQEIILKNCHAANWPANLDSF